MEEIIRYTPDMRWAELRFFPGKGQVKMLRDEPPVGARTIIVQLPAGGEIVPHTHLAAVQHYVLEGKYESEGKTFAAGTYRLMAKNFNVAPISTKTGVTILMIYDPRED
jgi:hypothetical protein